ncbi:MAG: peptidoglycan-binding domain-containing protein [Pseudomonadota bacterium]
MTPAAIGELQAMLARIGLYRGPEDGVLGPRSAAAVDRCLDRLPAVPAGIAGWTPRRRAAACRQLLLDALARRRLEAPCGAGRAVAASPSRIGAGGRDGRGGMGAFEGT